MESASLFELSSLTEAIGVTNYGRTVSIFVISCDPSLDELAVRLGGPGCPWKMIDLPMQQPIILDRQPSVRVARRATELAFATKEYVESPIVDADEVHPSTSMVAMDVLTTSAISAAASTLTTSTNYGTAGDTSVTELAAAADEVDDTTLAERGQSTPQPPLRVSFRWAIGQVLLGFTPPVEDAANAREDNVEGGEERVHDRAVERSESEASCDSSEQQPWHNTPPLSKNILPIFSPQMSTSAEAVNTAARGDKSDAAVVPPTNFLAHAGPLHDDCGDENANPHKNGAAVFSHDENTTAGVQSPFNLSTLEGPSRVHDNAEALAVTPAGNEMGSNAIASERNRHSASAVVISGAQSSPFRSDTPRRQRPPNFRRSNIQMSLAPAVVPPSEEANSRDETTEDPLDISEDDHVGGETPAPTGMQHPLRPPAASTARQPIGSSAPQVVPSLDPYNMMSIRLSDQNKTSCSTPLIQLPITGVTTAALGHQNQTGQVSEQRSSTAALVKAPASPRPTADNLFEGVDGDALIVMVGVVALYNINGTADPHRVASVEVKATALDKEDTTHHLTSHAPMFSFSTTPALRGLAAVVPQVSGPFLLLPHHTRDENSAATAAAAGPPPVLHTTCIVTEQVVSTEGGVASGCTTTTTTLWTNVADVVPEHSSPSPLALHPASRSPITHEVRFTGPNGDVVLTRWTYLTVSAYRDAVLNLRSRFTKRGTKPVLQMLLIDESSSKPKKSKKAICDSPLAAIVWVSSPSSSDPAPTDDIAHRVVTVSPAHGFVQQPVSVPVRSPLVYVAVKSCSPPFVVSHVQPIFPCTLSDAWTRLPLASRDDHASSDPSSPASTILYYRLIDASTAAAADAAAESSLPVPLRETPRAPRSSGAAPELREVTITIRPPASCLHALAFFTGNPANISWSAAASESDAVSRPTSAWNLVLRHAVTRTVLAEASPVTGAITYRGFFPVLRSEHNVCNQYDALGSIGTANADTCALSEASRLPWEVLLVPAGSLPSQRNQGNTPQKPGTGGTPLPARLLARDGSLPSHGAKKALNATAWSGTMWISCSKLHSAPSTGMHWKTSVCVSSTPTSLIATTPVLSSPSVTLGAQLEVLCAVRSHTLGADSAVFSLHSLCLVPSSVIRSTQTPAAGVSSLPLSKVQLWFTTSGGSAEDVCAAWGTEGVPSVKEIQHAWAPSVPEANSSCTPALCVDADGQLEATDSPILLSTTNRCTRLCVALTTATGATTLSDGTADAAALRHCVTAARKRAIRRYNKKHAVSGAAHEGNGGENQRQAGVQRAELFVQCVNTVAMRVENYAEVDLSPSLAAASERPGQTRHRLLTSTISGAIRMNRHVVLKLQGQWIKVPRRVTVVSEGYTPSPRLWGLRRSCIVRHPDPPPRAAYGSAILSDGAELAREVLRAHAGYDVVVQSVPLDYTDPSERTVQMLLPGVSYDKVVVQKKQQEARLQPYSETIRSAPCRPLTTTLRGESGAADVAEWTPRDGDDTLFKDPSELLELIFGPAGIAHAVYTSKVSRKVAVVHFFFGDTYTTRTALKVSCRVCTASRNAMAYVETQTYGSDDSPPPLSPSAPALSLKKAGSRNTASSASFSVLVLCDSLTRTSTLYNSLPRDVTVRRFPGESHWRYPAELTWYHGDLGVNSEKDQRRRKEGEAQWRRGLAEQWLGPNQKPRPFVVSATTQHPPSCLSLVVEPSLTRCADGRYYILFGGLSASTRVASSSVYAFDDTTQMWQLLRARRGASDTLASSTHEGGAPPRYGHTAVYRASDNAVYIFGGRDNHHNVAGSVYGDVWRMTWDTAAGTVAATELPCTWAHAPSAATASDENRTPLSLLTDDMEARLARWRHAAALHDDYMVVIGGQSSTGACCSCTEVLYLDLRTLKWARRRSFGTEVPSPRHGLAATVASGTATLYIFGGWSQVQRKIGDVQSAVPSGTLSGNDAHGEQSTEALSDFFKMDLITRMWSRVEPNGSVRPPALELADMTSCVLDGCPVILLVGGRPSGAGEAKPTTALAGTAQLEVFIFSTATHFWRVVQMDCTPAAARFGLRAMASGTSANVPESEGKLSIVQRAGSPFVRGVVSSHGQSIGNILVVGGLPLQEADIVHTAPAISMLLTAGNGSSPATRHVASTPRVWGESLPSQGKLFTPQMPTEPRSTRQRTTCPSKIASHKPHPPPMGSRCALSTTSCWLPTSSCLGESGDRPNDYKEVVGALVPRTPPIVPFRKLTKLFHGLASPSGRVATAAKSLNLHYPSCYSTLTLRQQRNLVRRLYTQGIEMRAAHRQKLQDQVDQERITPALRFSQVHEHSFGAYRSAKPLRQSSAPLYRPSHRAAARLSEALTLSATRDTLEANGDGARIYGGAIASAPLTHRDLQNNFLVCGNSSNNSSFRSPTTSSNSSSSSNRGDPDRCGGAVEPPAAKEAYSTEMSREDETSDSEYAIYVETRESPAACEEEWTESEDDDAPASVAATPYQSSENGQPVEEKYDHLESASPDNSSVAPPSQNAVVTAPAAPAPVPMLMIASPAAIERERVAEEEVDDDNASVAATSEVLVGPVTPAPPSRSSFSSSRSVMSGPSHTDEGTLAAEGGEEKSHQIERQEPDVPSTPPQALLSESSAVPSKSSSRLPSENPHANDEPSAVTPPLPEDSSAATSPLASVLSIPTDDGHDGEDGQGDSLEGDELHSAPVEAEKREESAVEEDSDWEVDSDGAVPAAADPPNSSASSWSAPLPPASEVDARTRIYSPSVTPLDTTVHEKPTGDERKTISGTESVVGEAAPEEMDDDYADAIDDWETVSNASKGDDRGGSCRSVSSAESCSVLSEVLEDFILPPAPREHPTPPAPSSVSSSAPALEDARSISDATEHKISSIKDTGDVEEARITTSSLSSPLESAALGSSIPESEVHRLDVAKRPLGVPPTEESLPSVADEGDRVPSSSISSLADTSAIAVDGAAAPVCAIESWHSDNFSDKTREALSSPALAASEEESAVASEESQRAPDIAVTPSRSAVSSPSQWDLVEEVEAEAPYPGQEGGGNDEAETSIDEGEVAPPPLAGELPERPAWSSDDSDDEGVAIPMAALSASSATLSKTPEILAAELSSHASSVVSLDVESTKDAAEVLDEVAKTERESEGNEAAAASDVPVAETAVLQLEESREWSTPPSSPEDVSAASFPAPPEVLAASDSVHTGHRSSAVEDASDSSDDNVDGAAALDNHYESPSTAREEEQASQSSKALDAENQHTMGVDDDSCWDESPWVPNDAEGGSDVTAATSDDGEGVFKKFFNPTIQAPDVEEMADAQVLASSVNDEAYSGLCTSPAALQEEESEHGDAADVEESTPTWPRSEEAPWNGGELSPAVSTEPSEHVEKDAFSQPREAKARKVSSPDTEALTHSSEEALATLSDPTLPSHVGTEESRGGADTPAWSEEEVKEAAMLLNDGRDLLDRRRGVVEAVQDDDFDF
ncbi:hypothetical protein JKF63_04828 [Porcisia hertigi]|uniref:Uncharacterized protein n=1 Tax=Porcisia hertigi TaxID=2761500 RepID=A0A836IFJ0_9TRYP|nr:hypothetical protein JKF63_04828 [Porcisia hertigi]